MTRVDLKKFPRYTIATKQSVLPLTEGETAMAQPKREEEVDIVGEETDEEADAAPARSSRPRTLGDLDALLAGDDDDGDDGDWDDDDEEDDEDDIPVGPAASLRRLGGSRFGGRFGRRPQIAQQVPMLQGDILRKGNAKQLIVQERTRDGEYHEWGRLPADASIEAMINLTGKAGHFLLMPIDATGRELLNEPVPKTVAPGHRYLRDMLAEMNPGAPRTGISVGGLPHTEYLSLFKELREEGMSAAEAARMEAAAARERAESDREAIWAERASLNTSKMEMTASLTADIADAQRQVHERELSRAEAAEARREREHQASLERERLAAEARIKSGEQQNMSMMTFMQMQMQQERERAARDRKEAEERRREERRREDERRADERRRDEARMLAEASRQQQWQQQQQQFFQMQMQMQMSMMNKEFAGKENLFTMKQQLLSAARTDQDPLLQMQKMMTLMATMREMMPEGQTGMLDRLMEMGTAVLPAMMGAVAPGAPMLEGPVPPPPPAPEATVVPQLPIYNPDDMSITMPQQQPEPVPAGYPPGYEPPTPVVLPADYAEAPTSNAAPAPAEAPPWGTPGAAPAPAVNSVPADVRNKARRILRNAVSALEGAHESQYGAVVLAQLVTDLDAMRQYLAVIPLHQALVEAGVSAEITEAVIIQLDTQGVATSHSIALR